MPWGELFQAVEKTCCHFNIQLPAHIVHELLLVRRLEHTAYRFGMAGLYTNFAINLNLLLIFPLYLWPCPYKRLGILHFDFAKLRRGSKKIQPHLGA